MSTGLLGATPRLVVVEGAAGGVPDLTSPGLVLFELEGASLNWGEVDFGGPIVSSTGTAFAVIFFPVDMATTDAGAGGGPGIGVRPIDAGKPFYLSSDGANWGRFDPRYELAVDVVNGLSRAHPRLISEMEPVDIEVLAAPGGAEIPTRTEFRKPFPNPFNPRVELSFALAQAGSVRMEVYDVRGRLVKVLAEGPHPAGEHQIVWEGEDDTGSAVASGVYFARFTGPVQVVTHRMALIR